MTSRKALRIIGNKCLAYTMPNSRMYDDEVFGAFIKLEKDLEILEIVKKHKLLNYVIKNDKCANMYGLSVKDKKCLKEWAELDTYNKKIDKHLEVLELLKNKFDIIIYDEDDKGSCLCVASIGLKCAYCELNKEETKIIKKWLKNE